MSLDPTSFTTPRALLGLLIHMGSVKRYDKRGTTRKFKAIALTDSVPLNRGALRLGNLNTNESRRILRARIRGELYDYKDPHSRLDDPCDPSFASKPDEALALIMQHTLCVTAKNFAAGTTDPIGKGDEIIMSCSIDKDGQTDVEYATVVDVIRRAALIKEVDKTECVDVTKDFSSQSFALETFIKGSTTEGEATPEGKECPDPTAAADSLDYSAITAVEIKSHQLQQYDEKDNHWRYQQPSLGNIKWLAETKGVKHIIRLNGDDDNATDYSWDPQLGACISKAVEAHFCRNVLKIEYSRVSSHDGCIKGQGFVDSKKNVFAILNKGNTLIHCKHGADRTGYLVAAWIKEKKLPVKNRRSSTAINNPTLEQLWQYTISFNSWARPGTANYICKHSLISYGRYLDGFWPVDDFCKTHIDCAICKPQTKKSKNWKAVPGGKGKCYPW